jgi:hypothetical protein
LVIGVGAEPKAREWRGKGYPSRISWLDCGKILDFRKVPKPPATALTIEALEEERLTARLALKQLHEFGSALSLLDSAAPA